MAFLAREYVVGIASLATLSVGVYLAFSIRLIKSCRKLGMDVCTSAMIPIYNVILWVRKCFRSRRMKREELKKKLDREAIKARVESEKIEGTKNGKNDKISKK